ncbi:MAG: S26 family signal peptidase [Haloferacaceae archaeon]
MRDGRDGDGRLDRLGRALSPDGTAGIVAREALRSVLTVALVGAILFSVSGLWPPMAAIESGSMEPEMYRGDLVFVVEEHRFSPDSTRGATGVVTYRVGSGADYRTFGDYGDVVVYRPNGDPGATPVIHRARFWVNASENWYGKANPAYLSGNSCAEVPNCPAPHAGFVTKGDANDRYDQVKRISAPVRPEWIIGTAELRIPYLGHVRLAIS